MPLIEHILRRIADAPHPYGLGGGTSNRLVLDVIAADGHTPDQVRQGVWYAISRGLLYLDYEQPSTDNWYLCLTEDGRRVLDDQLPNPDDPTSYLQRLKTSVPSISDLVEGYVREAVLTYDQRCYLASVVMLGIASEAAFLEMARAFARSSILPGDRTKLSKIIEDSRNFVQKFVEVRSRLQSVRPQLPEAIADSLALNLDAIADLLRVNRNEAGHPTGQKFDRADAFNTLTLFARYLGVLETLRLHFEASRATAD